MKIGSKLNCLLVATSLLLSACGGTDTPSSDTISSEESAPTVDLGESFEDELTAYADYKMVDTTVTLSGKEMRVLAADGIMKAEQLKEDIGFDQVEGQLLILTGAKEMLRQTFGWEWGAKVLKRDQMGFSPVGNLKFMGVENDKLTFRLMLIEYDQNKMYYLDYRIDSNGTIEENLREA